MLKRKNYLGITEKEEQEAETYSRISGAHHHNKLSYLDSSLSG